MTPTQIYTALATLLGISSADAEALANHLMALVLGRNTTESTSWRTSPPIQRNDLTTAEKMPTRILNSLVGNEEMVLNTISAFDSRFDDVVGNHYPGADDEEAFGELGSNLIQAVSSLVGRMDEFGEVTFLTEKEIDDIVLEALEVE